MHQINTNQPQAPPQAPGNPEQPSEIKRSRRRVLLATWELSYDPATATAESLWQMHNSLNDTYLGDTIRAAAAAAEAVLKTKSTILANSTIDPEYDSDAQRDDSTTGYN